MLRRFRSPIITNPHHYLCGLFVVTSLQQSLYAASVKGRTDLVAMFLKAKGIDVYSTVSIVILIPTMSFSHLITSNPITTCLVVCPRSSYGTATVPFSRTSRGKVTPRYWPC